jgi:hypothetical protein
MTSSIAVVADGTPEARLEAYGLAAAIEAVGIAASVVEKDVDIASETTTAIVVSSKEELLGRVRKRVGPRQTFVRTTGLDALRVFNPWTTIAYRHFARVLMRNRLEVAELGDRAFALLPSAARFASVTHNGDAAEDYDVVVLVAAAGPGSAEQWCEVATNAASEVGVPRLMAVTTDPVIAHSPDVEPLDVGRLQGGRPVVSPVHDVLALAEIFGAQVSVLDLEHDSRALSTAWVRAHNPAFNAAELVDRLHAGSNDAPTPADDLCRYRAFEGTLEDLGHAVLAALEAD